jgi:hypothetical protein
LKRRHVHNIDETIKMHCTYSDRYLEVARRCRLLLLAEIFALSDTTSHTEERNAGRLRRVIQKYKRIGPPQSADP